MPRITALHKAAPNPFGSATTIGYDLSSPGHVRLQIFDVQGRVRRQLIDITQPAGSYEVEWRGRGQSGLELPAGVYFYRLDAPGYRQTRKLLLMH